MSDREEFLNKVREARDRVRVEMAKDLTEDQIKAVSDFIDALNQKCGDDLGAWRAASTVMSYLGTIASFGRESDELASRSCSMILGLTAGALSTEMAMKAIGIE